MFVVVQNRNQYVEMSQHFTQPNLAAKRDREIWALAPLGEFVVQRMPSSVNVVTQWFE